MIRNKLVVLYGSQTGQSESIATDIHEDGVFRNYDIELFCLKDEGKLFNISEINCAVMVCSTTGDGDPPENARKFIRNLNRKTLPENHLSQLNYALLGLGDSNYSTFCGGPKKLEKSLKKCGAKSYYNSAFADDATDMEDVIEPWLDGLWPAVEKFFSNKKACMSKNEENETTVIESSAENDTNSENNVINFSGVTAAKIQSCNKSDAQSTKQLNDKEITLNSKDTNFNINLQEVSTKFLDMRICSTQVPLEQCLQKGSDELSNLDLSLPCTFPIYLEIEYLENQLPTSGSYQNGTKFPVASGEIIEAKIDNIRQLTSDDALKRTLEFTLISDKMFDFKPGDSFGICCENEDSEVEWLIKRLALEKSADIPAQLSISKNTPKKSVPAFIPLVFTIRQALKTCFEIRSVPKKPFLRALVECTSDPAENRRLQELVSKQGASEYAQHVREANVCILDILATFVSCQPSFCLLAQHLPRLMPRRYSIANSPLGVSNAIKFAFNVTRFDSHPSRTFTRNGVCTGMLEKIFDKKHQKGLDKTVRIFPTKSTGFCLPDDLSRPIVMIGPGTGVAPFVGFLEHRLALKPSGDFVLGESWLFTGCRHQDKDFLYKDTLEDFKSNGALTHLKVAFSRDVTRPQPKYVQDSLKLCSHEMMKLILSSDAVFYICGDARNMAKNVRQCFIDMIAKCKNCSDEEANAGFKKVVSAKRYLEDIWT
uniref:Methionine synthase reductase n=1 Tax=Phallusia mammillata TaxID=59560 RepID=A0A6F9DM10_9ASCI|nr:methionine synthase reductase-like [Phallusia mammillata]